MYKIFAVWMGHVFDPNFKEYLTLMYDPERNESDTSGFTMLNFPEVPDTEFYYSDAVKQKFEAANNGKSIVEAIQEIALAAYYDLIVGNSR